MGPYTPDVVPFIFEFPTGQAVQIAPTVQAANVPISLETPLVFVPSSVILVATLDNTTATQDEPISVTAVTANGADVAVERRLPVAGLNGANWTDISGATHATYTPAEADEGKALRLVVTYTGESTTVSAGVIQEKVGGDLVATLSGLTSGNAVQNTPITITSVTDNGANVLSGATYSWQVSTDGFASHTEVGTSVSYTPTEVDEGKALRLVVTYAGDAAGSESKTVSAGTVREIAAGDLAATLDGLIAGNAAEGAVVSVTTVTDDGTDVTLASTTSYQWQLSTNGTTWTSIPGATDTTYTPVEADKGKALQVVVTYAGDAAGSESAIVSAGIVQENPAGDLSATLGGLTAGNAFQGAVVDVATVTHAGEDVLSSATYQWQLFNGTGWTTVGTGVSYTPAEADEGKALRLVVNYTDETTVVSAGTVQEIAAGDLVVTLSGLTGGKALQDTPITVTAVTDSGANVLSGATYSWQLSTDGFASHTVVGTGASYTPTEADEGKALRLVVTYAADAAGSESKVVSFGAVLETTAGDLVAALGGLTDGNAVEGTEVSVTVTDNGTPVPSSGASYQWQVLNGTSWTDISGATLATYTPIQADEGKALRLVVTYAADAAGPESTTVSAGTVQEIGAGDLVATLGGLTGGNAVQDTEVSVTKVTDSGAEVSRRYLPVAGVDEWNRLDDGRQQRFQLHADRGRRRQGAAGGGVLFGREHDGFGWSDSGGRGRRSCGDAQRTDRRQRGPGHRRHRGDRDRRRNRCSLERQLFVAGFDQRNRLDTGRHHFQLHADRGRRRQGAAGGGDLCGRRGGA